MVSSIMVSAVLVSGGAYAFVRGLRPLFLREPYTVVSTVQLVGGLTATGLGMVWLMESIVTALAPSAERWTDAFVVAAVFVFPQVK